jgi:diguanylate cyclase (GGDEF)-like protein
MSDPALQGRRQPDPDRRKTPPGGLPASPPPVFGGALLTAAALVVGEVIVGAMFRLPLLPFIACELVFLAAILYAVKSPPQRSEATGRIITVAVLLKLFAVSVAMSGGITSPYAGILFLPVFLGALYFGLAGGTSAGVIVCAFFVGHSLWAVRDTGGHALDIPTLLTQCGVVLLVSVGAGAFAEHLRHTATAASRRARHHAARATQVEWFTDTAVMMQSLYDLEHMLSAALLRLEELVTCDAAAVYLRDPDDPEMSLAQTMGLEAERIALRRIPLARQERLRDPEFNAVYVPNALPGDPDLGAFAELDPSARSVVVVPLRTLDDLFGVLVVTSHKPGALTERDRDNLVQFARHIVYPIQRVRLQALATTDALTGLNNSRALHRRLRGEVERAQRYRHPLSLIMIDIDHFKRVNDTLGHPAGDAILTQIGGILCRATRGIDYPARYGGEELAILCPETGLEDCALLAERIRTTIAGTEFAIPDGSTGHVTVSIGVAQLNWATEMEAELIERADSALYQAKAGGRNRVRTAKSELKTAAVAKK